MAHLVDNAGNRRTRLPRFWQTQANTSEHFIPTSDEFKVSLKHFPDQI
jgi:hypothetical protein